MATCEIILLHLAATACVFAVLQLVLHHPKSISRSSSISEHRNGRLMIYDSYMSTAFAAFAVAKIRTCGYLSCYRVAGDRAW